MHSKQTQNRRKDKHKRKSNKTIQKLKRKRYDEEGNEIKDDDEPETIAVTQYQLTDDTNRDFDALLSLVLFSYFLIVCDAMRCDTMRFCA